MNTVHREQMVGQGPRLKIGGITLWDDILEVVGKSLGEVVCVGIWLLEGIVLGDGNMDGNGNEEGRVLFA